jgi:hypothetical protein
MTRPNRGQVLTFMALILPLVLLPLAAYAVDAATVSTKAARLQEVTAQAAEEAAQQVSVADLRSGGSLALDPVNAGVVAMGVVAEEPGATVRSVAISGTQVTVRSAEAVILPFDFLGVAAITLEARATGRLTAGYDSPSSRLALATRTF